MLCCKVSLFAAVSDHLFSVLYASLFTHINVLNIMNAGVDHETEMKSSFLLSSVMLDSNSYFISGCFSRSPLFHATVVAGVN